MKKFSSTLNLPKSRFPARLLGKALVARNQLLEKNEWFTNLYEIQAKKLKNCENFCINDGPPYANGPLHLGHAVNKVLKDTVNRYWLLQGKKIDYRPGWDCHGLPIELKAIEDQTARLTVLQIREKARNFANSTIEIQRNAFKSWGVMADWNNPYKTFDSNYYWNQMDFFHKLFRKGLIYRDFKPVYWSPSSQTALAEAELEYNQKHTSTAVYVRFQLTNIPDFLASKVAKKDSVYAAIWTTTPWTLISNEAIGYNENLKYCLVKNLSDDSQTNYVIAANCLEDFSRALNCTFETIFEFTGSLLENCQYRPLLNESNDDLNYPFLHGNFVEIGKGTGLVHLSPNHGHDDFIIFAKNKLKIGKMFVNEFGNFNENVSIRKLINQPVLTSGQEIILDRIRSEILHQSEHVHSYPYDWRTKKPVIIRASKQWFFNTNLLKEQAKKLIADVDFYPISKSTNYLNNIVNKLETKEFWCISRQRVWGVPIPVFYRNDSILINERTMDHFKNLLNEYGTDFWWAVAKHELVPEEYRSTIDDIQISTDIFDVWFDSGLSWLNVLPTDNKKADLVIEGIDQLTGWFQSSLLTSIAAENQAPYKSIFVHGFVVDKNGQKMSKSLGNVIEPIEIIDKYGIDVFRWWLVCHVSPKTTASVNETTLISCNDELNNIRLVLKYCLGVLVDYRPDESHKNYLQKIDKYLLNRLNDFKITATSYYRQLSFNRLCSLILNFLANDLSSLYISCTKDRLYADAVNSERRLAVQFVLDRILFELFEFLGPIVPHLVDEAFAYRNHDNYNSFFDWKLSSIANHFDQLDHTLNDDFELIKTIRQEIVAKFENKSQHVSLTIETNNTFYSILQKFKNAELLDILQIAEINYRINKESSAIDGFQLYFETSKKSRCDRCWKYACDHHECNDSNLCERCLAIVSPTSNQQQTVQF